MPFAVEHRYAFLTVRRSMRFCRGATTTRWTKTPGVWIALGIELADLDELLDLGDRDLPGRGRHRIEVARRLPIDEVARAGPPSRRRPSRSRRRCRARGRTRGRRSSSSPCPAATSVPTPGGRVEAGDARAARRASARRACPAARARPRARPTGTGARTRRSLRRRRRPSCGSGGARRSSPRPQSSTPQLFETTVRSWTPRRTRAAIRFSGIPQRPKPADDEGRAVGDVPDGLVGGGDDLLDHRKR